MITPEQGKVLSFSDNAEPLGMALTFHWRSVGSLADGRWSLQRSGTSGFRTLKCRTAGREVRVVSTSATMGIHLVERPLAVGDLLSYEALVCMRTKESIRQTHTIIGRRCVGDQPALDKYGSGVFGKEHFGLNFEVAARAPLLLKDRRATRREHGWYQFVVAL
uniref:Uncharacterized protein n=1 Tax=Glossina austeni TaxID=7395 RepID=A0A1A9UER6_GLOAU